MPDKQYYFTIETTAAAEYKDRGSAFLSYSFPVKTVADCKSRLQDLKKLHAKATHYCFAYRLGMDENNFRSSDDGEPSGTAGKPILGQIDARDLTNTLVVVVRYFGGTLLGVPGLVHAYKTAASLVLQCTPAVRKAVEVQYDLQFSYAETNEVMRILKQFNCTVLSQEMQLFCTIKAGIPLNRVNEALSLFREISNLEINVSK